MKTALEETSYELIKAHVLEPDKSPLTAEQAQLLDRVISVSKVLDKNPIQKNAIAIHMAKFPEIGKTQAFNDIKLAMRLFNTLYSFDYDFWQQWLINDIVRNIERCRAQNTPNAFKVISMEHANLIRALGEKPQDIDDPRRLEKNNFYIMVQNNNNQTIKIDANQLSKLPASTLSEINKALFAGTEITDTEAEEIMST